MTTALRYRHDGRKGNNMPTPRYTYSISFSPDEWQDLERLEKDMGITKSAILKAAYKAIYSTKLKDLKEGER